MNLAGYELLAAPGGLEEDVVHGADTDVTFDMLLRLVKMSSARKKVSIQELCIGEGQGILRMS